MAGAKKRAKKSHQGKQVARKGRQEGRPKAIKATLPARTQDELLHGEFGPLHEMHVLKREYKARYNDDDEDDDNDDAHAAASEPEASSDEDNTADSKAMDQQADDADDNSDEEDEDDDETAVKANSSRVASQGLMKCFWDLASLNPVDRIQAGAAIIQLLQASQEQQAEDELSPDTEYSLKRLVRGMGSNRKAARQGFGIVLTELLATVHQIPIQKVIGMVESVHKPSSSASGAEKRECQYGRLFSYGALIRSRALCRDENPPKRGAIKTIMEHLLAIGEFKNYVTAPATQVICELIQSLPTDVFVSEVFPALATRIMPQSDKTKTKKNKGAAPSSAPLDILSAQDMCFLMASRKHLEALRDGAAKLPKGVSTDAVEDRLAILRFDADKLGAFTVAVLEAQLMHPLWLMLGYSLAEAQDSTFSMAWLALVHKTLLAEDNVRNERRAIVFALIRLIAPKSPAKIQAMLSPMVMSCLMTNLAAPTKYLHGAANAVLATLVKAVKGDDTPSNVRLDLLARLTGPHGSRKLDQLTKTRTISGILSTLKPDEVREYVLRLQRTFNNPSIRHESKLEEETIAMYVAEQRIFALDQMMALFRGGSKVPKAEDWTMGCLAFCMIHSFFNVNGHVDAINAALGDLAEVCIVEELKHPLNRRTMAKIKSRYESFVNDLCSAMPFDEVPEGRSRFSGCRADGTYRIAAIVDVMERMIDSAPLLTPMTDEVKEAYDALVKLNTELKNISKGTRLPREVKGKADVVKSLQQAAKAFRFLVMHTIAMVFSDVKSVVATAPDLNGSYHDMQARIIKKAQLKMRRRRSQKPKDDVDSDVDPMEVLVDVLLGMIAQPSALLRNVVNKVFSMMCDSMTDRAIDLLCEVIADPKPIRRMEAEEDDEDDEDMDEDDDEGDDDDDDDDDDEDDNDDDDDSSDDDDDESDDSDMEASDSGESNPSGLASKRAKRGDMTEEEQLRKLKAKVGEALNLPVDEEGNVVDNDDEGADSDWDDERMMAVDNVIAAHFRQHALSKKPKQAAVRQENARFKLRLLDLIEVYMRKCSANPAILSFLPALFKAHRTNATLKKDGEAVAARLHGLYCNKLNQLKPLPKVETPEQVALCESTIKAGVHLVSTGSDKAQRDIGGAVTKFAVRALTHGETSIESTDDGQFLGKLRVSLFAEEYGTAIEHFLQKHKFNMNDSVLSDLARSFPQLVWYLVPHMAQGVDKCVNPSRLLIVFKCLADLLHQRKAVSQHKGVVKQHAQALVDFVVKTHALVSKSSKFKARHVRVFLQIVLLAARTLKEVEEDVSPLASIAKEFGTSEHAATAVSVFTMCKQILKLIDNDAAGELVRPKLSKRKQQGGGDDGDEDSQAGTKKNKDKNKKSKGKKKDKAAESKKDNENKKKNGGGQHAKQNASEESATQKRKKKAKKAKNAKKQLQQQTNESKS
ncbi:hypothetical protein PTSG_11965 [Salpingoeca rosetta]|uniref:Uncharacterized protein n=1 Tax=Salpingoeca rosetta (strain ATCC 50818 / BSB-021) TaxID=946362 RepID=F2U485_SALR5|nr:uncharacterized protein PTSG_11965 [Salpingoeca rosetta]EGD82451.1 hypothetical protein PTSG_11965 [Salpingoeca rosetta]|eukprot:XP_004995687.1 hypothetical protein PTSG_11965 [Salpingoeca rosetta]